MTFRCIPLGHSTVLLEKEGRSLLTDPVFSPQIFRIRRRTPLPIDPGRLPPLTAVLISHAHYDHLDLPSFKFIRSSIPIILPPGLGKLVQKFFRNPIVEISSGESFQLLADLKITAVPVKHWGFRLFPLRYTDCNGYLIEWGGERIFFAGDTAYRTDFAKLAPVDLALLPIGCYRPEWFMRSRHLNPTEAVRVFEELQARFMVPIHYGTFRLSTEPMEQPVEWLRRIAAEKGLADRIRILAPGETLAIAARPSLALVNA